MGATVRLESLTYEKARDEGSNVRLESLTYEDGVLTFRVELTEADYVLLVK